jgi:protein-L-isoaspartate(D-aspartate) O-methyltransferase
MERIDRGLFVRGIFAERAYEDMPLPIACGQTISQPSVVGLMTQALRAARATPCWRWAPARAIRRRSSAQLARRVYTVDRHRRLVREAANCSALGLANVVAMTADGSFRPARCQAPFDRILVTAAAEDPPGPLLAQLKIGGIMVVPVGQSDAVQSLIKVTRRHGFRL